MELKEIKEEKPKQKRVAKPKKKSSAEAAKLRAEEIRKAAKARHNIQPGQVLNGDPENWVYYHIQGGMQADGRVKAMVQRMGYEPCTDGETMVGCTGGTLYKCPKEIADERTRQKIARRQRR